MTKVEKVESVLEYLEKIYNGYTISSAQSYDGISHVKPQTFYRGQSETFSKSNLQAGLFRNKKTEFELIHQYMNIFDETFRNMTNNGERLAQMQHYGLATRLLDVTSLPLVALYFAVSDSEDSNFDPKTANDGVVFRLYSSEKFRLKNYYSKQTLLKTSSSDHLEVVSTLALLDETKKKYLYGVRKV